MSGSRALSLGDVSPGDELPSLLLPVTATSIVAGAIASRDFQDVHHDRDRAVAGGSKDIFMNILTTNGYVGRFVTDWAGPEARLRCIDIRLGAPNYPGDELRMTGHVESLKGDVVTVAVRGANSLGDHVSGTVEVELPSASA